MGMKNQLAEINIDDLIKAEWNYKSDGTEEQIEKLWSGNLLRVLDKVQEIAQKIQSY